MGKGRGSYAAQKIYICWIFLGSHLIKALHRFLLLTFDVFNFSMMTPLSRPRCRGRDSGMERGPLSPAGGLSTSKMRLSCCLKSYSTLDRHTGKDNFYSKQPKHTWMWNDTRENKTRQTESFKVSNLHHQLIHSLRLVYCSSCFKIQSRISFFWRYTHTLW